MSQAWVKCTLLQTDEPILLNLNHVVTLTPIVNKGTRVALVNGHADVKEKFEIDGGKIQKTEDAIKIRRT